MINNIKDYIEKKAIRLSWLAKKIDIPLEELQLFLSGKMNMQLTEKISSFLGKDILFFEDKNYISPKNLKEKWKAYYQKRNLIDIEIENIVKSFDYASFDERDFELILNEDKTLFVSLKEINDLYTIFSVEQLQLMLLQVMFRTIAKSPNAQEYLNNINNYFKSNISLPKVQTFYEDSLNENEDVTISKIKYLLNNNFDFNFEYL